MVEKILVGKPNDKIAEMGDVVRKRYLKTLYNLWDGVSGVGFILILAYFERHWKMFAFPVIVHLFERIVIALCNAMNVHEGLSEKKLFKCNLHFILLFFFTTLLGTNTNVHYMYYCRFLINCIQFIDSPRNLFSVMVINAFLMILSVLLLPKEGVYYQFTQPVEVSSLFSLMSVFCLVSGSVLFKESVLKEFFLYGNLTKSVTECNEKQEQFLGRICHVSRTSLNGILFPLKDYQRKRTEEKTSKSEDDQQIIDDDDDDEELEDTYSKQIIFQSMSMSQTISSLVERFKFITEQAFPSLIKRSMSEFVDEVVVRNEDIRKVVPSDSNLKLVLNPPEHRIVSSSSKKLKKIPKQVDDVSSKYKIDVEVDSSRLLRIFDCLLFTIMYLVLGDESSKRMEAVVSRDLKILSDIDEEETMIAFSLSFPRSLFKANIRALSSFEDIKKSFETSEYSTVMESIELLGGKMKFRKSLSNYQVSVEIRTNHQLLLLRKKESGEKRTLPVLPRQPQQRLFPLPLGSPRTSSYKPQDDK